MSRALVPHMRVFDAMGSRCFCILIGLYQFPRRQAHPHRYSPRLICLIPSMIFGCLHTGLVISHSTHHIPVVCPNDTA